jgi:protease-4
VWTGTQAKDLGLVDELGGLLTALRIAKEETGMPVEEGVRLVFYPKPKRLLETLLEHLTGQVTATLALPPPVRQLGQALTAFSSQDEGARFVMPLLLRIK